MNDQNSNNNNNNNRPNNRPARRFHKGPRRDGPTGGGPNNQPNQGKRPPQHAAVQGNNSRPPSRPQQQNNQHPRPRNQNNNQNNQNANSTDQLLQQYDRLVDQHIDARRKFHELFYRCDDNRLYKLEDQFYGSAQRIIKFERELRPWQLDILRKHRTEIYPPDLVYSTAHPEAEIVDKATVATAPPANLFHISAVQLNRPSYKDDAEISEGTLEDYLQYKSQLG